MLISQKLDQNGAHIIAPHLLTSLLRNHKIKQIHQDTNPLNPRLSLVSNPGDQRLAVVYVALPNAIAAHYYELVLALLSGDLGDVWFADD